MLKFLSFAAYNDKFIFIVYIDVCKYKGYEEIKKGPKLICLILLFEVSC